MTAPTEVEMAYVSAAYLAQLERDAAERDAYRDRALLIAAVCVLLVFIVASLCIVVVALGG